MHSRTRSRSRIDARLTYLRALIDHPRTSDHERDAARRAYQRLVTKYKTAGQEIGPEPEPEADPDSTVGSANGYAFPRRVYGLKYHLVRDLRTTDIAKLIRADIRMARKAAQRTAEPGGALKTVDPIGDAPAQLRFSVRSEYYSGGSSIEITIRNIPDAWGWTTERNHWGTRQVPTPELRTLAHELKALHRAYNYDGSDITTDYFDVNYLGGVTAENGLHLA
ncbi:hypothetical protein ACTWP5_31610 [Streptomyces sp. 4N509B]|uniref:hypothetical protein n=1 Tax=Streptomyces sp. 4N509B TaxID=3457413 RepID=UPI003FD3634C